MKTASPRIPSVVLPARNAAASPLGALFAPAEHARPGAAAVEVAVAELVLDDRIQPREKMRPDKIAEYAALLVDAREEGLDTARVFRDPLDVYVDPETGVKRVASGFHRTSAAVQARVPTLLAVLRPGGIYEARLWASGTNDDHGLQRSDEDRRRVLSWYLDDPSGMVTLTPEVLERLPEAARGKIQPGVPVALSYHLIGHLCKVSQSTVSRLAQKVREARAGAAPTDAAHQLFLDEAPAAPALPRLGADGRARRPPVRSAALPAPAAPRAAPAPRAEAPAPPAPAVAPTAAAAADPPTTAADTVALRLRAWQGLHTWGEEAKAAGLGDGELVQLLVRQLVLRVPSLPSLARRYLQRLGSAALDEVLLPPAEEGALWFVLHRHPAPWDALQAAGADDGELLRALQAAFGQHGEHTGHTLRVTWRGGTSPEVRLHRLGEAEAHAVLQGQELLRAARALLKIPSARGGHAGS